MKIHGATVSGVKEIVINHAVYRKTDKGYWIHQGKHGELTLSHDHMVHKIHGVCSANHFHIWVSGNTVNAVDPSLFPRK